MTSITPIQFEHVVNEIHKDHFLSRENNVKLLSKYSPEELDRIYLDLEAIRQETFKTAHKASADGRVYAVTAGGPGAGKSTLQENTLGFTTDNTPNRLVTDTNTFAYVDPDRRALFFMKNTFVQDVTHKTRTPTEAYNYWRDASNFIANTLLALALTNGYDVAHGTTMTAPAPIIDKIMDTIHKTYGYSIRMLHVTAPDDIRDASIKKREGLGIVQSTEEDFRVKGKAFFERLPRYVAHADTLEFYYRDSMQNCTLAAIKTTTGLQVINAVALAAIEKLHDEACGTGYWQRTLQPSPITSSSSAARP